MADGGQIKLCLRKGGGFALDLAAGVEDCRVVAVAECTADGGERLKGVAVEEVHGDVASSSDALGAALAADCLMGHIEVGADGIDDSVWVGRSLWERTIVGLEGVFD